VHPELHTQQVSSPLLRYGIQRSTSLWKTAFNQKLYLLLSGRLVVEWGYAYMHGIDRDKIAQVLLVYFRRR